MPELLDVQYEAFPEFVRVIFMGCHNKDDVSKLVPKYIEKMQNDPSDVWIKITDNATGKIIAAADWKIFPGHGGENNSDEAPEWLDAEEKEKSRKVIEEMTEIRKKIMPGPYVRTYEQLQLYTLTRCTNAFSQTYTSASRMQHTVAAVQDTC